ncbi:hypothetical protein ABZ897_50595 [Nonomuraea sp. NPDC046802]|uniref:hypothetical protein n=1 Tax=Nonomuraea sp. NPDC046802 TaxID=3154919 RepID=UPI0033C36288
MGTYDDHVDNLHRTLQRAGIDCNIDPSRDEHVLTIPIPRHGDFSLLLTPSGKASFTIQRQQSTGSALHTIAENVGTNDIPGIVEGLLLANAQLNTDGAPGPVFYRHDVFGRLLLIENGKGSWRMAGRAFRAPLACAIVTELNAAILAGRTTGGTSAYWIEGDGAYVQNGPHDVRQLVPVQDLPRDALRSLVFELNGAVAMGAHV